MGRQRIAPRQTTRARYAVDVAHDVSEGALLKEPGLDGLCTDLLAACKILPGFLSSRERDEASKPRLASAGYDWERFAETLAASYPANATPEKGR